MGVKVAILRAAGISPVSKVLVKGLANGLAIIEAATGVSRQILVTYRQKAAQDKFVQSESRWLDRACAGRR